MGEVVGRSSKLLQSHGLGKDIMEDNLTEVTWEDIFGNVVRTEYYDLRSAEEKKSDL